MRAFLERPASATAPRVLLLDCRTVEPTERGFLAAAGGFDDVEAFVRHLRGVAPPVVLVLDHYEVFRLMDTWLRQVLVPALPAGASLLLAGRERPVGPGSRSSGSTPFRSARSKTLTRCRCSSSTGSAEATPRASTGSLADIRWR